MTSEMSLKEKKNLVKILASTPPRIAKQEPFRIHVAIFPSIAALAKFGVADYRVTAIRAHFSKSLAKDLTQLKGGIFRQFLTEWRKIAIVDWNIGQTKQSYTVQTVLDEIKKNEIPDMVIDHIGLNRKWMRFDQYTLKNEEYEETWLFKPYTFRKGIWKRLKAINFPAKKLYEEYIKLRKEVTDACADSTKKRWRDTILMNDPHPNLTNEEIRRIWQNEGFVLILKEARGNFELMDMGEWRA